MSFTKVAPAGIGTEPGSSIQIGDSLLHSTGIDLGSGTGIGASITRQGNATFTGIVTAASFSGSGANLTGVASTGNIKTSTTANFTGGIQVGGATTLTGALTGTTGTFTGNLGVGGVLTYEDVTNVDSVGVITARDGLRVTGIATISGAAKVGGGVDITTAGSGVFYTPGQSTAAGINFHDSDLRFFTSNTERFRITSGGNLDTFDGTTFINKHSVGIGTTTTAGRNAGVGTAAGTVVYNSQTDKLEVYTGNLWASVTNPFEATGGTKSTDSRSGYVVHTFTSPGNFTVSNENKNIELLVIGGGGGGGEGGGGAGALYFNNSYAVSPSPGTYAITVGGGGSGNSGSANAGTDSTFGSLTAAGGGKGGAAGGGPHFAGGAGGSGGGGRRDGGTNTTSHRGPASGAPGGSANANSPSDGWGNIGGYGAHPTWCGAGGGGGAGSAGGNGSGGSGPSETGGNGGSGLAYSITGSSVTRAGGGGGGMEGSGGPTSRGGNPGPGGGGQGGYSTQTPGPRNGTGGTVNTGSGGGGTAATGNPGGSSYGGGSGVVIVAYTTS